MNIKFLVWWFDDSTTSLMKTRSFWDFVLCRWLSCRHFEGTIILRNTQCNSVTPQKNRVLTAYLQYRGFSGLKRPKGEADYSICLVPRLRVGGAIPLPSQWCVYSVDRTNFTLQFDMLHAQSINPLTPEWNPSAQRCLTRFFYWDFTSWTVHFVNICVKNQQIHQLFIQFNNYVR
jgi:hypothetical protein